MSDQNKCLTGTPGKAVFALLLGCLISANAAAVIDGTGNRAIDGTGSRAIDGTGLYVIDGTGSRAIDGTGNRAIDGTGNRAIDGTGSRAIDGTGLYVIDGTGSRAIDGTGNRAIDGTGNRAIDGTGSRAIDGTGLYVIDGTGNRAIDGTGARVIDGTGTRGIDTENLLARGQIDYIGDDFISVMGQTVFDSSAGFDGLTAGMTVAIYGAIDRGTGGFIDTQIMKLAPAGVDSGLPDYLRGIVDSVDAKFGVAVIGGMMVDYTAMLSSSGTPQIGDEIAIQGRNYRDLGRLVASP